MGDVRSGANMVPSALPTRNHTARSCVASDNIAGSSSSVDVVTNDHEQRDWLAMRSIPTDPSSAEPAGCQGLMIDRPADC